MATKLYVGNLPFNTTENELQELFSQAGPVQEVMLMQDKFTGKSRGFAFVTMASDQDAQKAISEINGKTVEGRALTVNEARPREARPPGGVVAAEVTAVGVAMADNAADANSAQFPSLRKVRLGRTAVLFFRRA